MRVGALIRHDYTGCDLVAVERQIPVSAPIPLFQYRTFYVYRASTHEMVGAYQKDDIPTACGPTEMDAVGAGVFPGGCTASTTILCGGDAGADGSAAAWQSR